MKKILCWLLGHKIKREILTIYDKPKVVTILNKNSGTTSVSNCRVKITCMRCGKTEITD